MTTTVRNTKAELLGAAPAAGREALASKIQLASIERSETMVSRRATMLASVPHQHRFAKMREWWQRSVEHAFSTADRIIGDCFDVGVVDDDAISNFVKADFIQTLQAAARSIGTGTYEPAVARLASQLTSEVPQLAARIPHKVRSGRHDFEMAHRHATPVPNAAPAAGNPTTQERNVTFEIDQHGSLLIVPEHDVSTVPLADVFLHGSVGSGANGQVFKGVLKTTSQEVAVKVWAKHRDGDDRDKLNQGVKELLKTSKYPSSVELHDAEVFNGHLFVVMEFVHGVSLREWRSSATLGLRWRVAKRVLELDVEARERGVLHGDLHDKNIMLEVGTAPGSMNVRIIDPGASKLLTRVHPVIRHIQKIHETITQLLMPFRIGRLWGHKSPHGVSLAGRALRIECDPELALEPVSAWHRSFVDEFPYLLNYLGLPKPAFQKMLFVDFDDRYPKSSKIRHALDAMQATSERLAEVVGPPEHWGSGDEASGDAGPTSPDRAREKPRDRVLGVLQKHADEAGHLQGVLGDIRGWLAPDGTHWDIPLIIIALWKAGQLREPDLGGSDDSARFAVSLE